MTTNIGLDWLIKFINELFVHCVIFKYINMDKCNFSIFFFWIELRICFFRVISQSQSVSFAAGLTGIAGALSVSQYYPVYGNQGNVVSFGSGTSSSTSSAASSAGSTHSFSSSPHVATIELVKGMPVRFPGQSQHRPIWTNIRPNINNNGNLSNTVIII